MAYRLLAEIRNTLTIYLLIFTMNCNKIEKNVNYYWLFELRIVYFKYNKKGCWYIMFQIIMRLLAVLMLLGGVILLYDARLITKKFFGFGDQNEASTGLKILGFLIVIIGGCILYFNR